MSGTKIGLKDLYYAKLTADTDLSATYGTPSKIAPAISATITPNVNSVTLYADDQAIETAESMGDIEVEVEVNDIPNDILVELLGLTKDANGVIINSSNNTSPYIAIGFRSLKSNGKYRYVWLYKGKFQLPTDNYKTKGESAEFQSTTISAKFVSRTKDGKWKAQVDEDDEGIGVGVVDGWFASVYE